MDLRELIAGRVTAAREHAGLNQSEAAKALGIDRARLAGMERGERPVDATMLLQLAQVYRTAIVNLLPVSVPNAATEIRFRGVEQGALTAGEAAAIEGFQQFCEHFAQLLSSAGAARPKANLLDLEPGTSRTRRYAVEADADELRHAWNLGGVAPIGSELFDHLEDHGVAVYRRAVSASQLSGASVNHPGLGPVVFVNASDTPPRQVFTAAHELAHLLYHLQTDVGGLFVSRKLDTTADEQLANDFASAFLMPAAGIKLFLSKRGPRDEQVGVADVIALQRHFKVSYAAMLVRLRKLGILRGAHFEDLRAVRPVREAEQLGYAVQRWEWAYAPKLERPQGLPDLFVNLVLTAHAAQTLSPAQAASCLEMTVSRFTELLQEFKRQAASPSFEDELQDAEISVG